MEENKKDTRKGLLVGIYQSGGSCSNGGISSRTSKAILVGFDRFGRPIPEIFDVSDDCPAVEMKHRPFDGTEYYYAEPAYPVPAGTYGWMAGGCFIYTSDSRFPFDYPLPLHDRAEQQN